MSLRSPKPQEQYRFRLSSPTRRRRSLHRNPEFGIHHLFPSVLISKPSASTWNGETIVGESPAHAAEGARAELDGSPTIATLSDVSAPPTLLMAKSRYFSPSHWLHSVILNLPALKWLDEEVSKQGECWQGLQRCRALGESLKAQRLLLRFPGQYGSHLPDKDTSSKLLGNYLRTFETIYRIVHVPTLKREHKAFLENNETSHTNFIITLQLCMALGACVSDGTFSFRPQALQWIHEAREWLESSEKRKLTMSGIQIMCLVHLAQQATESLYGDRVWILNGTLLRSAIYISLHRDPTKLPRMSVFQAQMRRRLWLTVMELVLDASVDSGQSPFISEDDYDCELPADLNDDQIGPDMETLPALNTANASTDMSLQIALNRSIGLRLSVAKHWSKIKPTGGYASVLQLGSELEAARQLLNKTLSSLRPEASQFQHRFCDTILMRYLFILHMPFVPLSNPLFCHSHKTCVDAALELSYLTLPASYPDNPFVEAIRMVSGIKEPCLDFDRLVTCGSGSFRITKHLATSMLAADLASRVAENGVAKPGSALRIAEERWLLRAGVEWAEARIRAGQDNVKDYVFFAVVLAGVEAQMNEESAERAMEQGGREVIDKCVEILTEMAGDYAVPQGSLDSGPLEDIEATDFALGGQKQSGIITYGIAPKRLNPLAGAAHNAIFNVWRRFAGQFWYIAPPMVAGWYVMYWAEQR
ncbi:Transcription factor lepE [Colletotrichum gloeosporioides]|uniref:Cytochrome b-c1 complex subunit 8 n=1 Tax=Colletotrichum gloeosporioides TaxID=474922 RepID=A0A8H4CMI7_COLGL|nr:Transcription factor lepE [Colletotrichum gloeosporioides]KAF3806621.1 Transcription factor lepE [Colletotrichum gloeosporioides]